MFECKLIMENAKIKEMTGTEVLSFVPFTFDLNSVTAYRQSLNDDAEPEEYTVVYTERGEVWCIDVSYDEFSYQMKLHKNKKV